MGSSWRFPRTCARRCGEGCRGRSRREGCSIRPGRRCEGCGALFAGKFKHYDHINPVVFSHDASLENCQVLCIECHTRKTGEEDIPAIAKSNRVLAREAGLTRSGNIRTWRSR